MVWFLGEALHALATVSDLVITSKTKTDMAATAVTFDHKGKVSTNQKSCQFRTVQLFAES